MPSVLLWMGRCYFQICRSWSGQIEEGFDKTISNHQCHQRPVTGAFLALDPLCYTTATTVTDLYRSGELPQTCRALSHCPHSARFWAVLSYPFPDMHRFNNAVLWEHAAHAQSVFGGYVSLGLLAAFCNALSLPGSSFSKAPVRFWKSLRLCSFFCRL